MIRALAVSELKEVQRLAHIIWPVAYKEILSQAQLEYMLDWMYSEVSLQQQVEEGHLYFGIFENEQMLGFMDIQMNCGKNGEAKLNKLYVLPDFHGKKLGFRLLQKGIELAKAAQQSSMILQVNRHNKAFDFYKKVGFTIREEKDFDIGKGYFMNDYVMELGIGAYFFRQKIGFFTCF